MNNFNYYDELKNGNIHGWASYINKHYMHLNAPTIKIFKLDKERTIIDDFYGEVQSSRLYLPPFEMKAFHLTNTWEQLIGSGSMPYLESEEDMSFIVNFEDMVQVIRDLQIKKIANLYISYSGAGSPTALKKDNYLILKINDVVVEEIDLEHYSARTVKKLSNVINSISDFSATFEGDNDVSTNLINFKETRFNLSKLHIYTPDYTYSHITDVIEKGDLILTNKWRLYEVSSNMPGNDFGWEFTTFVLHCNLRTIDEAILPGNYVEQIKKHQYGLTHKIDMESGRS